MTEQQYRPRLIDRLLAAGPQDVTIGAAAGFSHDALRPARQKLFALFEQMEKADVFVADEVMEYMYAGTNKEIWSLHTDFGPLNAPQPLLWVECARPSRVVSEVFGIQSAAALPTIGGYLVVAQDKAAIDDAIDDEERATRAIKKAQQTLERSDRSTFNAVVTRIGTRGWGDAEAWADDERVIAQSIATLAAAQKPKLRDEQLHATLGGTLSVSYFALINGRLCWVPLSAALVLDPAGCPIGNAYGGVFVDDKNAFGPDSLSVMNPLWLTLSCMNAGTVSATWGDAPPEAAEQRWRRRHGRELTRYRELTMIA